ncbi:MAG: hypothetical protein CTY21_09440 [Methylomonas sp.]|nr:MAG: hypothetical protein CTY21_09440 [Methylomonas sp.]
MSQYIITITDEPDGSIHIGSVAVHTAAQITAGNTYTLAVRTGERVMEAFGAALSGPVPAIKPKSLQ